MHVCGITGLLLFGGLALIVYIITVIAACLCHEGNVADVLVLEYVCTLVVRAGWRESCEISNVVPCSNEAGSTA
jgi:hypothetical protein